MLVNLAVIVVLDVEDQRGGVVGLRLPLLFEQVFGQLVSHRVCTCTTLLRPAELTAIFGVRRSLIHHLLLALRLVLVGQGSSVLLHLLLLLLGVGVGWLGSSSGALGW